MNTLTHCDYNQAASLIQKRKYAQAASLLLSPAQAGDPDAQQMLGNCCYNQGDYDSAAKWYEKAASQGHVRAMTSLAGCCQTGEGVPYSPTQALYWFRQAAQQGDTFAMEQLSYLEEDLKKPSKPKSKTQMEYLGDSLMEFDKDVLVKYSGNETHVVIPPEIRIIGKDAFKDCTRLQSIVLPDSLERIEDQAFWNCTALQEISIPDSVRYIGYWAFCGCENLSHVQLPAQLETLEVQAFRNCSSLKNIILPKTTLQGLECSCVEEVTFLPGIEEIRMDMFFGCRSIRKLHLPDSVVRIISGRNSPKHTIALCASENWKQKNNHFFRNSHFYPGT